MRRMALAGLLALMMLVPATSASAQSCAQIEGTAVLDFGTFGIGQAKVVYDGEPTVIYFVPTGFVQTGPNTADIFFDWFFPDGVVQVVEHSETRPLSASRNAFRARVDVIGGGSGGWFWYGQADVVKGIARIEHMVGEVCVG